MASVGSVFFAVFRDVIQIFDAVYYRGECMFWTSQFDLSIESRLCLSRLESKGMSR